MEQDFERHDDDYVFRAGFRMPANDRKIMTLPFLANSMRNKLVLNKPEGKRKRPVRQNHNVNRVENVVREVKRMHVLDLAWARVLALIRAVLDRHWSWIAHHLACGIRTSRRRRSTDNVRPL